MRILIKLINPSTDHSTITSKYYLEVVFYGPLKMASIDQQMENLTKYLALERSLMDKDYLSSLQILETIDRFREFSPRFLFVNNAPDEIIKRAFHRGYESSTDFIECCLEHKRLDVLRYISDKGNYGSDCKLTEIILWTMCEKIDYEYTKILIQMFGGRCFHEFIILLLQRNFVFNIDYAFNMFKYMLTYGHIEEMFLTRHYYRDYSGKIIIFNELGISKDAEALLKAYIENNVETVQKLRQELNADTNDASDTFAIIVFLSDDLLKIVHQGDQKTKRFMRTAMALPMELQMVLSNRLFEIPKDIISIKHSEVAFKKLAKLI
jgi:hypothetical protein